MTKKIFLIFIFLFFITLQKGFCAIPAYDGHILDAENVLTQRDKDDINSFLTSLMYSTSNKINVLVLTTKKAPIEVISPYVREMTHYYAQGQGLDYRNVRTLTFTVDEPDFTVYYSKISQFYPSDYGKFPPNIRHEFKYYADQDELSKAITIATYLYAYNASKGKGKFHAPIRVAIHRFPPFGYIVFILIFGYFWFYCLHPRNRGASIADSAGFMQPHIFKNIKKDMGYDKSAVLARRMADLKKRSGGR